VTHPTSDSGEAEGLGLTSTDMRVTANADASRSDVGNVGKNMLATIVGNLFPPLALLVTAPLLAHSLGVKGRGEVAGATSPLFLVVTAATFGMPQAVTYAIARSPAVTQRILRSATLVISLAGAMATGGVILAAPWFGGDDPGLPRLIIAAALAIVPNLALTIARGVASGLHRWTRVAMEQFVSSAAELVALVVLAATGLLTPFTGTVVLAFSPITGAIAYVRVTRHAPSVQDRTDPLGAPRHLFSYGSRIWIGALSGILLSRLDQTVMTPLSSAFQLGIYATAVTVSQVPLVINNAVRDVTFSADASERLDERLALSARVSGSACALVGIITGISMHWWIPWLFGANFHSAVPVAAVLICSVVLGTPGSVAGAGLSARGRPGLRSLGLVVACPFNVALVVLLVPHHGAMGAAIATLVGSGVASSLAIYFTWRFFGVPPQTFYGLRRSDVAAVRRFIASMLERRPAGPGRAQLRGTHE